MAEEEGGMLKKAVSNEKWEDAQKTAFTYWINTMLARRNCKIDDLQTGFQDGVKLIILAEVLVGKPIGTRYIEKPKLKAHKINNAYIGLKFLAEVGGVQNITISAENIVASDFLTLLLGFCWQLLKTFQQPPDFDDDEGGAGGAGGSGGSGGKSAATYETRLFNWVKKTLADDDKYGDIDFSTGFKSEGFRNGKALLGLINEYDPDFVDYPSFTLDDANNTGASNCSSALSIAQEKMNIPAIIDGDELAAGYVGDKQLVLYLSLMYNAYQDKQKGQSVESLVTKIKQRESTLRNLKEENLKLKESCDQFSFTFADLQSQYAETQENHSNLTLVSQETEEKLSTLKEEWGQSQEQWQEELSKLKAQLASMMEEDDAQSKELQNQWDRSQEERDRLREELRKAKEQLTKEKEELEARNRRLLKNEKRARRMKEELQEIMSSQQETFEESIVDFRKHFLIHIRDMNTWRPYLEEDRAYDRDENATPLPDLDSLLDKTFNQQLLELIKINKVENGTLKELLAMYEKETDEIVSVTIGKKQKRTKKYAWEQQFPEDVKADILKMAEATTPRATSPRDDSTSMNSGGRKRAVAANSKPTK